VSTTQLPAPYPLYWPRTQTRLLPAVALAGLLACEPHREAVKECVEIDRAAASAFVVKCAEAANPKSDEEGEDLVAQCEETARRLHCVRENWFLMTWNATAGDWDRCLCGYSDVTGRAVCARHGWDGK
jgi:hypothetical protein